MKKFKKVATSLLCLAMSGSMLFSFGCGDDKGSGAGALAPVEIKESALIAGSTDKVAVLSSVADTFESLSNNTDQILRFGADLDIEITEKDYAYNDATGEYTETVLGTSTIVFDAEAYLKATENGIYLDAWLDGANKGGVSSVYAYAAAYIRENDLYAGTIGGSETKITADQKAAMEYYKQDFSAIIEEMVGSTGDITIPTEVQELITEYEDLITAAAKNVFDGLYATMSVDGDNKTIVFDFKKEMEGIVGALEHISDSLGEGKTVNDLLANDALENLFDRYLGQISAQQIYEVVKEVLTMAEAPAEVIAEIKAPVGNISGYQYLVTTFAPIEIDETGATVGGQQIPAGARDELLEAVAEIRGALAEINSLKFAIRTTSGKLSGIAADIDIKDEVDLYVSLAMETVASYKFKDVSKLNLAS